MKLDGHLQLEQEIQARSELLDSGSDNAPGRSMDPLEFMALQLLNRGRPLAAVPPGHLEYDLKATGPPLK